MPAAPAASRSPLPRPKPQPQPARPKMTSLRPSAAQHKSVSSVKKSPALQQQKQQKQNHHHQQRSQPARSGPKPGSKARAAPLGRLARSTPHPRSPQTHQHVHRHIPSGKHGSSPVYVVCKRKHYDDGFYARCQRVLRRWVKWGR
ncbi:hypothetical protein DFH11DRAFT_1539817 [Phellopilus nigrolimitatus]|nr:hypothetical protein DFH11DRAFT_1539817 [Phellopilus nigrolimitatus]